MFPRVFCCPRCPPADSPIVLSPEGLRHVRNEAPAVAEAAATAGKPLVKRLKSVGIVSIIVVVQCVLAYFFFPKGGKNLPMLA